ncbi:MAG TPA: FliM/FliN family flagellar motor switch protein [Terriglobales bacterium]|nr:FliM/FliN family flagellar motor switch protein [Terriglobales bacterium]
MSELTLDNTLAGFVECLGRSWSGVLQHFRGMPHTITRSEVPRPDPGAEPVWLAITFAGVMEGEAALVISAEDARTLFAKAESGEPSATPASLQDALRQSVALALSAFQEQHGKLMAKTEVAQTPAWVSEKVLVLTASADGKPGLRASLLCGPNLRINQIVEEQPRMESKNETLNLVMEAGLDVSLRFGQQRLTLGRLAELGPGAVVELDRRLHDPVELVLNGKVLARGEVMVVDGNYGLRVTEVCQRGLV